MIQSDPMTRLMRQRLPLVVIGRRSAGQAGEEDDGAVVGGVAGVVGGEGGVSEETAGGGEGDGVDVEGVRTALTESFLHGGLLGGAGADVVEPVGVGRACRGGEGEGNARAGVVGVQGGDLTRDHGVAVRQIIEILVDIMTWTEYTYGMLPCAKDDPAEMTWKYTGTTADASDLTKLLILLAWKWASTSWSLSSLM